MINDKWFNDNDFMMISDLMIDRLFNDKWFNDNDFMMINDLITNQEQLWMSGLMIAFNDSTDWYVVSMGEPYEGDYM